MELKELSQSIIVHNSDKSEDELKFVFNRENQFSWFNN
jgi:hypothetical protein